MVAVQNFHPVPGAEAVQPTGQIPRIFFVGVLILFSELCLGGCGFKTPPTPLPETVVLPAFAPPVANYRGSRLKLSWAIQEAGQALLVKSRETPPGNGPELQIEEYRGDEECPDCDEGWFVYPDIPLHSERILVEGTLLILYNPLKDPSMGPVLKRLRLTWLDGEGEELLTPVILSIPPRPVFPDPLRLEALLIPEVPTFVEHAFNFGMVTHPLEEGPDSTPRAGDDALFGSKADDEENEDIVGKTSSQNRERETAYHRQYTFRIGWPESRETVYRRFPEAGEITQLTQSYRTNLYLLDSTGKAPELPLNTEPLSIQHYLLQKSVLLSLPGPALRSVDSHPGVLPLRASFYVDLRAEKEDILLVELRLVDRLGNEGPPGPPTRIYLPRVTVAELSWGARAVSPSVY